MKNLFPITLVLMSFIASPIWSEAMDDLVEQNGIIYKKFSQGPFTGQVDEGNEQGSFKNGVKYGTWVQYYERSVEVQR